MENDFYKKTQEMFSNHLDYDEVKRLRIVDTNTGELLNIDYSLVLFDSDMNFYKKDDGDWTKIENPRYQATIATYEQFKNPE